MVVVVVVVVDDDQQSGGGVGADAIAGERAPVHGLEAAQIIVLLTAIAMVALWRTALRWLIALASTVIIATLGFGLIMIWQITHHMAG